MDPKTMRKEPCLAKLKYPHAKELYCPDFVSSNSITVSLSPKQSLSAIAGEIFSFTDFINLIHTYYQYLIHTAKDVILGQR